MLEFQVLGSLEVTRDGAPAPIPSLRQRALIARLLLGRGRVVSADALGAALWESDPPRDVRHTVHTYVSRARALLGSALVTRAPGYLLAVEADAVDADRFEAGVARAGEVVHADPRAALVRYDELLALWRGAAYEEFADSFAQAAATRLNELRLVAREGRAEAMIRAGAVDRAVGELGELVAEQPLRERPHTQLMRALYLTGRQGDALDLYARFRERMLDELGVDPSPVIRQTHEDVLRQAVEPPAETGSAAPARTGSAGTVAAAHVAARPAAALPVTTSTTSFVGREDELRKLAALVGGSRMVTLVGPGGVGKTRLAREMATRGTGDERAVWWVDLVPAREPDDVPYRFVQALGLPEPAEGRIDEFLVDTLRSARALLVVDNCEHVIEPVAGLLGRVVSDCAGVATLATSREPLAVPGEQVMFLPPLPVHEPAGPGESPAVALFTDRFRSSGGAQLAPDDMPVVAELCQRLDGLPLAIELAAARARSLGITAVAARPVLDLLTGVRHAGESRHRSLRTVVDWSHHLLDSRERLLFRRLATFSGRFSLDDAESVCADGTLDGTHVATALAGLLDKSMVAGPERDRYWLLDTMRAYAAEQLAKHGEERWVSAAHARHFVAFAERAARGMLTSREREWAASVADRIDELRVTHRWACAHDADLALRLSAALAQYATYHMRFELQDWAAAAAELPGADGHPLRATVLGSAAAGAWSRGDFEAADRLARRGVAAAADGQDPLAALPLVVLGDIGMLAGRSTEAHDAYQAAARLAGDAAPRITCEALGGQAIALSHLGDTATALQLTDAGIRLARQAGGPGVEAFALYFAGECRMVHDPVAALELLEDARRLAAGVDALFVFGVATLSAASLRARTGAEPVDALAAFGEAIEHWRRVGNRTQQWVTLRNLVPILVAARHDELAVMIDYALRSAPVQLPSDVAVPEAGALAEAVAQARMRLGDAMTRAVGERAAGVSLDDLVSRVLGVVQTTTGD